MKLAGIGKRATDGLTAQRLRLVAGCVAVSAIGTALGLLLVAQQHSRVGPVNMLFELRPSVSGGSQVHVPPLGTIRFDSHEGPLALRASVQELRADVARSLADDPGGFATLGNRVDDDLRKALLHLAVRALLGGVVVTSLVAFVAFRSWRLTAICVAASVTALAGSAAISYGTLRPTSLREPTFTGLLTSAPTAIGKAEDIVADFSQYRLALGQLVGNVVELYDVTAALPTYDPGASSIAVLHVSDLHLNPTGIDLIASLVEQFDVQAVLDTGDLTDHGTPAEHQFVDDLRRIRVPYVFVRGNHDSSATAAAVARLPHATVLDTSLTTVAGLRVAGIADPRFTPDKTNDSDAEAVTASGRRLADLLARQPIEVDVALVHDPAAATALFGHVPLVLAGHRHHREEKTDAGTLLLVGGSTGGAGLRALEGDIAKPLECRLLYFDPKTRQLQAWDQVTVGGLGAASVTVERHLVAVTPRPAPSSSSSP